MSTGGFAYATASVLSNCNAWRQAQICQSRILEEQFQAEMRYHKQSRGTILAYRCASVDICTRIPTCLLLSLVTIAIVIMIILSMIIMTILLLRNFFYYSEHDSIIDDRCTTEIVESIRRPR